MKWHFVKYMYISQTYKIDVTVCFEQSSKSLRPRQTGISQQFCMQPRQVLGFYNCLPHFSMTTRYCCYEWSGAAQTHRWGEMVGRAEVKREKSALNNAALISLTNLQMDAVTIKVFCLS